MQVSHAVRRGAFSPWTLSGSIVVDGVSASTHTAWPGEAAALAVLPSRASAVLEGWLPHVHHAVQAPLRALFHAAGPAPLQAIDHAIFAGMQASKAGTAAAVAAAAAAAISTPASTK